MKPFASYLRPAGLCALLACCGLTQAQTVAELSLPKGTPLGSTLVLGFLGGWEKWNDPNRGIRRVITQLREDNHPNLFAESCSNHHRDEARVALLAALDSNGNGTLEPEEKTQHKVILFGQSLGGGAVILLARELQALEVPVALTIQIDSVSLRDGKIPANVAAAANYYQHELLTVQGEDHIEAEDPAKTRILGNYKFRYPIWRPSRRPESRIRRVFGGGHARMEADPNLWRQIKTQILAAATNGSLPPAAATTSQSQ